MKKIYAWVNDEVYEQFKKYCEEKGISMYSVLKQAVEDTVFWHNASRFAFRSRNNEPKAPSEQVD